jgi:subtilase family serine protease
MNGPEGGTMAGGVTPRGKTVTTDKAYISAWKKEIIDPLALAGFTVHGFDPTITISVTTGDERDRWQISVGIARQIIEHGEEMYLNGGLEGQPDYD